MQQFIYYYCPSVCDYSSFIEGDNDAQFYSNRQPFVIQPGEEFIIIIRNCGNHWLPHGLTYLTQKVNNHFYVLNQRPFQQGLLCQNRSKDCRIDVSVDTPLSTLLQQPIIYHRLIHMDLLDLLL